MFPEALTDHTLGAAYHVRQDERELVAWRSFFPGKPQGKSGRAFNRSMDKMLWLPASVWQEGQHRRGTSDFTIKRKLTSLILFQGQILQQQPPCTLHLPETAWPPQKGSTLPFNCPETTPSTSDALYKDGENMLTFPAGGVLYTAPSAMRCFSTTRAILRTAR